MTSSRELRGSPAEEHLACHNEIGKCLLFLALNCVSHSEDHVLVHCGDPGQCLAGGREHSVTLQIPCVAAQVEHLSPLPVKHCSTFSKDHDSDHRWEGNVNVILRR